MLLKPQHYGYMTGHQSVLVFGGQAGSEGKGKVCADIALRGLPNWGIPEMAVCSFMTNAGHTAYIGTESTKLFEKVVVQQIPIAAVNPDIMLFIGPGAAITLEQLRKEIAMFDAIGRPVQRRLVIHPRAVVIDERHREQEAQVTKRIASTMKGCGAALAGKVLREPHTRLVSDVSWVDEGLPSIQVGDTTDQIMSRMLEGGDRLLVEGAQGYDLDINLGLQYPNCTSRMANPTAILADCGLPFGINPFVIAVVRTYPIRVGNITEGEQQVGYSGDYPSEELTWDEVARRGGWAAGSILEKTTVTGRVRRVFDFAFARFFNMLRYTMTDGVALMFADYLASDIAGIQRSESLNSAMSEHRLLHDFMVVMCEMMTDANVGFTHIGTGPYGNNMIRFNKLAHTLPFNED